MTDEEIKEQVRIQLESFDEIIMGEETRSISSIDLAGITGAIRTWRADGVKIAVTAMMWEALPHDPEEKKEFLPMALLGGWVPFFVGDNRTEYRIVKSARGKGFFGGEKIRFRFYELMQSGRFRFISEHNSINMAIWALNKEFLY